MSGYSQPPPPPGGYAPPPGYPPPPPPSYSYSRNGPMMTPGRGMPPPPPPPGGGNFGGQFVARDPKLIKEKMSRRFVFTDIVLDVIVIIMAVVVLCVLQFGHSAAPLPYTLAFTIPWIAIMLACIILDVVFLILKWEKKATMMLIWMGCVAAKVVLDLLILILYIVIVFSNVTLSHKGGKNSPADSYLRIVVIWIAGTAVDVIYGIISLVMMGKHWNSLRKQVEEPAQPLPAVGSSFMQPQPTPMMT